MNENNQQNKHGIKIKKGDILNKKYLVLSHISSGGTSEVYLVGETAHPEKRWAVKITKITSPLAKSIVDEANILSEFEHPNLPYIVDFFSTNDYHFLVMEYIHGVSLSDYLSIYNQPLPLELTIKIGMQLCDVLEFLHSQKPNPIIYRDIKPGNILIKDDQTIKLIDFGTAKKFQKEQLIDTMRVGTVGFAAPEQFEKRQTDERTDLYSLGALFYYLLSNGKYVNVAQKPIKELHSSLPESLEQCVTKLIEADPEKRIQEIDEVKLLLLKAEEKLKKQKGKTSGGYGSISFLSMSVFLFGFLIFTFI